ncbi:MAG: PilZ domain-containing protein [Candidatus Aminicenantales bacterium]
MREDKRKFRRFECLFPVEIVKVEGKKGVAREAKIDNISREGFKLVLSFDFSSGTDIELKIPIPGKRASTLVSGEVVWSQQMNNKWEIGVRIREMDKAAKNELLDLSFTEWREKMEKTNRKKKR